MKNLFLVLTVVFLSITCIAQETVQWRGDNRDGKYNSTGLLKKWPSNGPELLWNFDELGDGHTSAVVTDEIIFITGLEGDKGVLYALTPNGKLKWKKVYGPEWNESYPGTRTTPLLTKNKLYLISGLGVVYCLNANNGEKIWSVDVFKKYDGRNIKWGITENMAIDGNKLFCVPGGKNANVIALNTNDGSLIWKCKGKGEKSAYCSPTVINHNGRKIFVTQTEDHILGVDVNTGKLLWTHEQTNKYSVHANTPLYHNGELYILSGYGKGGVMLSLSEDGSSVTEKWFNSSLDSRMGGVVLHDGKIYGGGDASRKWHCVDWETGKDLHAEAVLRKKGNIIWADDMLYAYDEMGYVALLKPTASGFEMVSKFKVPHGTGPHWAHTVIHNKKLYVRHGNSLMAFDIAAK